MLGSANPLYMLSTCMLGHGFCRSVPYAEGAACTYVTMSTCVRVRYAGNVQGPMDARERVARHPVDKGPATARILTRACDRCARTTPTDTEATLHRRYVPSFASNIAVQFCLGHAALALCSACLFVQPYLAPQSCTCMYLLIAFFRLRLLCRAPATSKSTQTPPCHGRHKER